LLALLGEGPKYGYQLRSEFEERTGGSWPLNIGQVYTTLGRLERDGLVEPAAPADAGEENSGQQVYAITVAGLAEMQGWFASPVPRVVPARDELAIKVALAVALPEVDPREVLQRQRVASMATLQSLTRSKRDPVPAGAAGLALTLILERSLYEAEAELRWLDHCEAVLMRAGAAQNGAPTPNSDSPVQEDQR